MNRRSKRSQPDENQAPHSKIGSFEMRGSPRGSDVRKKAQKRNRDALKGDAVVGRSKFKNVSIRVWWSMIMLLAGVCVMSSGITLFSALLTIIYFVYKEYMSLKIVILPEKESVMQRLLQWYLFCVVVVYCAGDLLISNLWGRGKASLAVVAFFLLHKRMLLFLSYCLSLVTFVLSLKKSCYRRQFLMFAWMSTGLLLVWCEVYATSRNLMAGPIWVLLPILLVIINDSSAYFIGQLFGSTPLIKVSPRKTWEGFIGGIVATIISSILMSGRFTQYPYMYCPMPTLSKSVFSNESCERAHIYISRQIALPKILSKLPFVAASSGSSTLYLHASPFQLHSLLIAIFVSLVAPFAGFLASGLKRALKIKDFSNTIPGHGGVIDRVDCHLLTLMFVFVYHQSFIRVAKQSDVSHVAKYAIQKFTMDQIKELITILTNYVELTIS